MPTGIGIAIRPTVGASNLTGDSTPGNDRLTEDGSRRQTQDGSNRDTQAAS